MINNGQTHPFCQKDKRRVADFVSQGVMFQGKKKKKTIWKRESRQIHIIRVQVAEDEKIYRIKFRYEIRRCCI